MLRSALASNRANLWDGAQAHLIGFRAGLVDSVLDKSATTLASVARGMGTARACAALRLVHRVEVDVGFQVAQFTGRADVVAALRPFVQPTALLQQQPTTTTPRAQTPSSAGRLAGPQAQYQHPALGVPFSPAVMLPGQSSGNSIQVAIRCWDSEWSGPLDVPLHQAVGTSAYSYLTLKQVRIVHMLAAALDHHDTDGR